MSTAEAITEYHDRTIACGPVRPGLPHRHGRGRNVPAIAEAVSGYDSAGLYGISVRNGTPPDIIDLLNRAVTEALNDPTLVARLAEFGGIPKPMRSAEFGKRVADEAGKWRIPVAFTDVSVD